MKKISLNEINQLLSIIPRNYPAQDIFHLTIDGCGLCEEINKLCKTQNYQYDLLVPNESYREKITNCGIKADKFNYNKSRYNKHSRLYDFVFVQINLKEIENIEMFYKKLYAINKNGGKVLFIIDKDIDICEFTDELIDKNYVAVNPIEDTFQNYQILSAQKMHGWGN